MGYKSIFIIPSLLTLEPALRVEHCRDLLRAHAQPLRQHSKERGIHVARPGTDREPGSSLGCENILAVALTQICTNALISPLRTVDFEINNWNRAPVLSVPGAHHEPLEWAHAHRRVHGAPAAHGAHAAPVAQVAGDR